MQVSRPPCWTEVKRHLLLLILFTGFIFSLTGQDFILPDLILEKLIRPDISQPAVISYAAEDWAPILPAFRRMYPVSAAESINAEMILPGKTPAGTIDSKIIITDIYYSSNLQSDSNLPNNYRLSTGAEVDIREGSDLFLNFNPSDKGVLGAVFFIPFPSSSPRPMSGELNWFQMDRLSADIRLGIKDDEGIVPYSLGHMSWNGGMLRPDSYFTDFHIYGIDNFGFSMDTGIEIDLDFNDTNWSLYSKIEGGGWYSHTINGGFARTVLAAGMRWPGSRVSLKAGADIAYSVESGISGTPFVSIQWIPLQGLSFYADGRLKTGIPKSVDSVLRKESLVGFNPEIPISTQFRVGFARSNVESIFYRMDISYGYGSFVSARNGVIHVLKDKRIYGSAGFGWNFGVQRLELSGIWDISAAVSSNLWETRLEYSLRTIALYLAGGSEDAILAGYLPGIRGEQPIMGLGINWNISENWEIETFTYTEIPWNSPSLRFSLNWRK